MYGFTWSPGFTCSPSMQATVEAGAGQTVSLPYTLGQSIAGPVSIGPETLGCSPGGAWAVIVTLSIERVNGSAASPNLPVVPAGASAVVGLETSSDLKTWTPTTNGTVTPGTNAFYRVRIDR